MQGALLLIGCGKMGGALLDGWLARHVSAKIHVVDPAPRPADYPTVSWHASPGGLPRDAAYGMACLAVKPQDFHALSINLPDRTPVLSIMAGVTLEKLGEKFPGSPVVRAMPNLAASVGAGISVACPNGLVDDTRKLYAHQLLEATGPVEWVGDESLLDAVTALSGSGPAYLFHLIDILGRAGVALGLSPDLAARLARQTMTGAAELVAAESGKTAAELRAAVTSKGGTTEAALAVLNRDDALYRLFEDALKAATARSRELSGQ